MLKKLSAITLTLSSGSFAHIKPFEHKHIGFLHLEDVVVIGLSIVLVGASFLLLKATAERFK